MPDNYTWDSRHKLLEIALDADQAERDALLFGSAPVEAGVSDDRIAGVVSEADIPEGRMEEWAEDDGRDEEFSGNVLEEISRRSTVMGECYPYKVSGSRLEYRGSHTYVYEFCLAISLSGDLTKKPRNELPKQFEMLSTELARRHLSPRARAIRTGWPSHHKDERPVRFKALAQKINAASGEWIWNPSDPNPDDPSSKQCKDEGVDFVAWIPFGDQRAGQLFLLGQCACGKDWLDKFGDLSRVNLEKWLRPPTYADFQRTFAIPVHIPGWHIFGEVARRAGVPLDRARLALVAEDPAHREEISKMFRGRLDALIRIVFPKFTSSPAAAS